jgi:hypothetical protein
VSSKCLAVSEADLSLYMCLTIAGADHNACVDVSLKGEPVQPASPKPVEGEATQSGVLIQQNDVTKGEEEAEAPPFSANKPDVSCPEESDSYPVQPPLDESTASTPTELAGNGDGGLYELMSVIQSDGQGAQALETSGKFGSEEPALRHMEPPAESTIEKGKYQPGEFNLKHMAAMFIHLT